ncbi:MULTISPECIES: hypothetical protein [Bacillus cereus group]|uniref:Phage protein n=1 Tax=Bacillus thuringiensis subsp. tolworthi TaxID=1442 RepID=A0A9W4EW53_BACTO|nr:MULTISPECIES: hypothetical protein [Bacillus cereus group]MEB8714946.1 hypothetical protein [Bacillus cereus]MEB9431718.1 hypothetical protein [Bacillus cereus]MEB9479879.1 hypothetical protein [Bacillus cereus]MEB9590259.1 hypothetical protein [Bacillus cereus]MRB05978.1 hypothetical protein [Bacillus thuringiensis]
MFDWLKDYQKLEEDIALLEYNLDRTKAELKRWISGDLREVRLTAESEGAKVEKRLEVIELDLAYKMNEMHNLLNLINEFKGLDNKIIRMKYIEGMTLPEIACALNYNADYIKRRHSTIARIIKFADKIKK